MRQYIVDAFADRVFEGNPAAVCLMDHWPEEELLQKITIENALHETAFVVPEGEDEYRIRWMTLQGEINLCGHATLAAAYVLNRFVTPQTEQLRFQSLHGPLTVRKKGGLLELDFPAYALTPMEVTDLMEQVLGVRPVYACRGRDLLCVLEREEDVIHLKPDLELAKQLKGALLHVTAPGSRYDCVSRTFGPKIGIVENPVCGSGHCHIVPYWTQALGKKELVARQASPRGGTLYCSVEGDRVLLAGRAKLYAQCELLMEELS